MSRYRHDNRSLTAKLERNNQTMKNLKVLILGLGLTASFGLSACGDGGLGKLKKLKDKACACKDLACATAVTNEMAELKDVKETDEAKKVLGELTTCLTSAMTGGAAAAMPAPAGE